MSLSNNNNNYISTSDIENFKRFACVKAPKNRNIFCSFIPTLSSKREINIVLEVFSLKWTAGASADVLKCCDEIKKILHSYQRIEDIHLNDNVCKSFD
jgi:hypothetical protein